MIARRDLIMGAACLAGAAGAYALKPRRYVSLLKSDKMADIVPAKFGPWISEDISDPLALNQKDSLTARLYNELVVRVYTREDTQEQVSMLLAYGARQSDELQLHRPEVCYPAFGYTLTRNEPRKIPLARGGELPVRQLRAEAEGRRENIIYWSRLGEYLPQDGGQQREARFETALQGVIPDGLLARFSVSSNDTERAWAGGEQFILAMLAAVAPARRNVLVGTERAKAI